MNVLAVKYEEECSLKESIKSCKCKGDKNFGRFRFKWVKKVRLSPYCKQMREQNEKIGKTVTEE